MSEESNQSDVFDNEDEHDLLKLNRAQRFEHKQKPAKVHPSNKNKIKHQKVTGNGLSFEQVQELIRKNKERKEQMKNNSIA